MPSSSLSECRNQIRVKNIARCGNSLHIGLRLLYHPVPALFTKGPICINIVLPT